MQLIITAIEDTNDLWEVITNIVMDFFNSIYEEIYITLPFKLNILLPIPLILNRLQSNIILLRLNYHYFSRICLWRIDTMYQPNIVYELSPSLFQNFIASVNKLMNGVLLQEYFLYLHHQHDSGCILTNEEFITLTSTMILDDQINNVQLDESLFTKTR